MKNILVTGSNPPQFKISDLEMCTFAEGPAESLVFMEHDDATKIYGEQALRHTVQLLTRLKLHQRHIDQMDHWNACVLK
jgi:hypothetical protein